MDILYKIWAFLGFLAFIQIGSISDRIHEAEHSKNGNLHEERNSLKDDMAKILAPYIGKEVSLDFYEDEEDMDLFAPDKHDKSILLDIDPKWVLIRIETPKKNTEKLIRISSIKGVELKE